MNNKICDDTNDIDGKGSSTFDLCDCCTACDDCGRYMKRKDAPEAHLANWICPECFTKSRPLTTKIWNFLRRAK